MTAYYNVLRLLVTASLVYMSFPNKSWLLQAKSAILRTGRMEYLLTEKERLENAVLEANRVESVLREENAELKRKINTLNMKVSSLRKKELLLQTKHRKQISDLDTKHASTIAELQDVFKKTKSKEIASVASKLREQHDAEKRDLRTSLQAAHQEEVTTLKKSLSSATASLEQREIDIKRLKDDLALSQAEVKRCADKVAEGIAEKAALVEVRYFQLCFSSLLFIIACELIVLSISFQGIQTLSKSLEHMKRAEAELRAIRMEETRQTSIPASPAATVGTTISSSTGASFSPKMEKEYGKADTDVAPVWKKEKAEPDQEKLRDVLDNVPEGVAHIRTNPLPPPPPTVINQHQHTGAANTSATGRTHSNRKAAVMRARRSYSTNSPNT